MPSECRARCSMLSSMGTLQGTCARVQDMAESWDSWENCVVQKPHQHSAHGCIAFFQQQ